MLIHGLGEVPNGSEATGRAGTILQMTPPGWVADQTWETLSERSFLPRACW